MTERIAPITNMVLARQALAQASSRAEGLPGLAVFYGPAGYGKTFAAAAAAAAHDALYITAWPVWTQRAMLEALARELGITSPARGIPRLLAQVIDALEEQGRALIIDEMDHVVEKRLVELIRTLHDATKIPVLMIGEEALPARLKAWERFHSRILSFTPALSANLDDAKRLAQVYADGVVLHDELATHFLNATHGNIRRLSVNLSHLKREARRENITHASLDWWGERPLYTGDAPRRRLAI